MKPWNPHGTFVIVVACIWSPPKHNNESEGKTHKGKARRGNEQESTNSGQPSSNHQPGQPVSSLVSQHCSTSSRSRQRKNRLSNNDHRCRHRGRKPHHARTSGTHQRLGERGLRKPCHQLPCVDNFPHRWPSRCQPKGRTVSPAPF